MDKRSTLRPPTANDDFVSKSRHDKLKAKYNLLKKFVTMYDGKLYEYLHNEDNHERSNNDIVYTIIHCDNCGNIAPGGNCTKKELFNKYEINFEKNNHESKRKDYSNFLTRHFGIRVNIKRRVRAPLFNFLPSGGISACLRKFQQRQFKNADDRNIFYENLCTPYRKASRNCIQYDRNDLEHIRRMLDSCVPKVRSPYPHKTKCICSLTASELQHSSDIIDIAHDKLTKKYMLGLKKQCSRGFNKQNSKSNRLPKYIDSDFHNQLRRRNVVSQHYEESPVVNEVSSLRQDRYQGNTFGCGDVNSPENPIFAFPFNNSNRKMHLYKVGIDNTEEPVKVKTDDVSNSNCSGHGCKDWKRALPSECLEPQQFSHLSNKDQFIEKCLLSDKSYFNNFVYPIHRINETVVNEQFSDISQNKSNCLSSAQYDFEDVKKIIEDTNSNVDRRYNKTLKLNLEGLEKKREPTKNNMSKNNTENEKTVENHRGTASLFTELLTTIVKPRKALYRDRKSPKRTSLELSLIFNKKNKNNDASGKKLDEIQLSRDTLNHTNIIKSSIICQSESIHYEQTKWTSKAELPNEDKGYDKVHDQKEHLSTSFSVRTEKGKKSVKQDKLNEISSNQPPLQKRFMAKLLNTDVEGTKGPKFTTCKICGISFASTQAMRLHMKIMHNILTVIKCRNCSVIFESRAEFDNHSLKCYKRPHNEECNEEILSSVIETYYEAKTNPGRKNQIKNVHASKMSENKNHIFKKTHRKLNPNKSTDQYEPCLFYRKPKSMKYNKEETKSKTYEKIMSNIPEKIDCLCCEYDSKRKVKCSLCEKSFINNHQLLEHYKIEHDFKIITINDKTIISTKCERLPSLRKRKC